MPKFRRRPVVVTAEQFWPAQLPWPLGVSALSDGGGDEVDEDLWGIEALPGLMYLRPGDWVITDVDGERYPCRDAVFRTTYELAEETL